MMRMMMMMMMMHQISTATTLAYSELTVCGSIESSSVTMACTACWDNRGVRSSGLLEAQGGWASLVVSD